MTLTSPEPKTSLFSGHSESSRSCATAIFPQQAGCRQGGQGGQGGEGGQWHASNPEAWSQQDPLAAEEKGLRVGNRPQLHSDKEGFPEEIRASTFVDTETVVEKRQGGDGEVVEDPGKPEHQEEGVWLARGPGNNQERQRNTNSRGRGKPTTRKTRDPE